MLAEKAWIAEQVEHQASEFEEMKARWAAKAAEAKVRALSSTHRLFCVTGDLFENSSPRGTARLSSPCTVAYLLRLLAEALRLPQLTAV